MKQPPLLTCNYGRDTFLEAARRRSPGQRHWARGRQVTCHLADLHDDCPSFPRGAHAADLKPGKLRAQTFGACTIVVRGLINNPEFPFWTSRSRSVYPQPLSLELPRRVAHLGDRGKPSLGSGCAARATDNTKPRSPVWPPERTLYGDGLLRHCAPAVEPSLFY
jgi:hypothetical protein